MIALPCDQCHGACCVWPSSDHTPRELAPGVVLGADGRCEHLTQANRCSIYDRRPDVCRQFTCNTKRFRMAHPSVDALLTHNGIEVVT